MSKKRVDDRMQLGYGSAWHMLRCLGFQRELFSQIVADAVGGTEVEWLDFTRYQGSKTYPKDHPILDDEWKRVNFLSKAHPMREKFDEFWPHGSDQNWDAVGWATVGGQRELLIVEAKGHIGEIKKRKKEPKRGGQTIADAFQKTREKLECQADPMNWLKGYYQHANRLATLYFLNCYDPENAIPARLLFIYFCGDTYKGKKCPKNPAGWNGVLTDVKAELGLGGEGELEGRVHDVFLPVNLPEFTIETYKRWKGSE